MCTHTGAEHARRLMVSAVVADAFDGSARLLGDAQRFGFGIHDFHVVTTGSDGASIRATLTVPRDADAENIRCRLGRHGSVLSLEAA